MKSLKFELTDGKRDKRALAIFAVFVALFVVALFVIFAIPGISQNIQDRIQEKRSTEENKSNLEQQETQEKERNLQESKQKLEEVKPLKYSDLTPEQLQRYFNTYKDPFVIALRRGLNGYLDGTNEGTDDPETLINGLGDMPSGLKNFSQDYYRSKFVVLSIDNSIIGGKEMYVIFKDKPDKIFWAWVYDNHIEDGLYDRYNLRGFAEKPEMTEEVQTFLIMYEEFIQDEEHCL